MFRRILLFAFLISMCFRITSQNTRTTWLDGDASFFLTWTCFCVPAATDNVIINNAVTISGNTTYNDITISNGATLSGNGGIVRANGNVTVDAGGEIENIDRMDIYGDYTLNGVHSGSANVRFLGDSTTIDGTGQIANTGRFQLSGAYKEFAATADLEFLSDRIQLLSNVFVLNKGRIVTTRLAGNSSRTWRNDINSYLELKNSVSNNLNIFSDAAGSELVFSGTGSSNYVLPNPANSTIYNLTIDGDNLSSRKKIRADLTILGDLRILTSTFDVRQSGTDANVIIHGNWMNEGGAFDARNGTVTFGGSSTQTINAPTSEDFYNLNIAGSGITLLNTPIDVDGDLNISSSLDVNDTADYAINLGGDFISSGSFLHRNGMVNLVGSSQQTISGNLTMYDLSLQSATGGIVGGGQLNLIGTLSISSGNFNANGNLTLISDINGTARVAEITGGLLTGNMTMERYIASGATNWRFLSSAVSGATLNDWNNDFITSGFPGSDFPSFPFTSILSYDETKSGIRDTGYVSPTSANDPINVGEGYLVWCGDSLTGTTAFTIDVDGPANTGNISLPVTFTSTGNGSHDGWNVVGNPYPSSIDWDGPGWTKTNMHDAIYVWDANLQQFASYVAGVGTNGGSAYIPSSQAFWVQADTTAPVLSVTETVKADTDRVFLRKPTSDDQLLVRIEGSKYYDETVIRINDDASQKYDAGYDARKLYSSNPDAPAISSIINHNDLSVNSIGSFTEDIFFLVKAIVSKTGTYSFDFILSNGKHGFSCILWKDLYSLQTVKITGDTVLQYALSDTTTLPRFEITMAAPVTTEIDSISCHGYSDGAIHALGNGPGPWSYTWFDETGTIFRQSNAVFGEDVADSLGSGNYRVQVGNSGICAEQESFVRLTDPDPVTVDFDTDPHQTEYLAGTPVGFINRSINARSFIWEFGDGGLSQLSEPEHVFIEPGTYKVSLTASNGDCVEKVSKSIEISNLAGIESHVDHYGNVRLFVRNKRLLVQIDNPDGRQTGISIFDVMGRELSHFESHAREIEQQYPNSVGTQLWIVRVQMGSEIYLNKVIMD